MEDLSCDAAYFDVVPGVDAATFGGLWSSYRFDSGTTVVSAIESGLFVLLPNLEGEVAASLSGSGAGIEGSLAGIGFGLLSLVLIGWIWRTFRRGLPQ